MSDQDREQVKIKKNDEDTGADEVEAHVKGHNPNANDEGTDEDDVQAHVKGHQGF